MRSSASLILQFRQHLLDHVIAVQLCEVLRDLALAERVIQRIVDQLRLDSPRKFPDIREFYRENCNFGGLRRDSTLSCSDFSHNSLRKLTGKIFRRTGNFWPVTGNFICENPKITIRRSLAFLV